MSIIVQPFTFKYNYFIKNMYNLNISDSQNVSVWAYKTDLFKPKFGEIDWDKIRAERNALVDEAAEPEDDDDDEDEEEEEAAEEEEEAVEEEAAEEGQSIN